MRKCMRTPALGAWPCPDKNPPTISFFPRLSPNGVAFACPPFLSRRLTWKQNGKTVAGKQNTTTQACDDNNDTVILEILLQLKEIAKIKHSKGKLRQIFRTANFYGLLKP